MQIIKGSDMTQQQQYHHSSVDAMSAAPFVISSQQRPVQEPSYPYDTVYPPQEQQQVVITEPPQPPASAMQGNHISIYSLAVVLTQYTWLDR